MNHSLFRPTTSQNAKLITARATSTLPHPAALTTRQRSPVTSTALHSSTSTVLRARSRRPCRSSGPWATAPRPTPRRSGAPSRNWRRQARRAPREVAHGQLQLHQPLHPLPAPRRSHPRLPGHGFIQCLRDSSSVLFDSVRVLSYTITVRRAASASLYEWLEILLAISARACAQTRDFVQLPCMDCKFRYNGAFRNFHFSFLCAPKPEHERPLS